MNSITLVANLVDDPKLSRTKNTGRTMVRFTVALNEGKKANGEKSTLYLDCVAYDQQAEKAMNYFKKGNPIGVVGRLIDDTYTNKDGIKVKNVRVMCDRIDFVGSGQKNRQDSESSDLVPEDQTIVPQTPVSQKKNTESFDTDDDDIPW